MANDELLILQVLDGPRKGSKVIPLYESAEGDALSCRQVESSEVEPEYHWYHIDQLAHLDGSMLDYEELRGLELIP